MIALRRRRGGQQVPEPTEAPYFDSLATWWAQATPGTTYVRADVPAKHLPGRVETVEYSTLQLDADGSPFVFGQDGLASIWIHPGNATRAILMSELQEQGHKVLVEVDDNYLVPPPPIRGLGGGWVNYLDRTEEDRHSFQAHARIVRWCDGVIVTTDELASRYVGATSAPIFVCPNSIDLDDWPAIDRSWGDGNRPRVGYAGSDSHIHDLSIVEGALDWAFRDGSPLVKVGAKSRSWRWEHTQVPWANTPAQYRVNMSGAFDIGLCPLQRGNWQDCKSDLKVLEYLASGILPVVQANSPVYSHWVGVVPSATTKKQWARVTRELANQPLSEIRRMHQEAYDWMVENKLIGQHIHKWREAVA